MELTAHLVWGSAALIGLLAWRRAARRRAAGLEAMRRFARAVAEDLPLPPLPEPTDAAVAGAQAALVAALAHQQRQREAADRERRRLQGVLGGMVEGVLVIDAQGTVLLSNRGAEELLQLPPGENYTGRPLIELTRHPDLHELVRWAVSEGGLERDSTLEVGLGGTGSYVLQVTATPVDVGPDAGRAFILVFHDITQLKRLERMRRDFVANVSHEVRTPLAAIAGYTETLLAGAVDDPERARHFLGIIERHAERLGRLVNDLLTLSDLELGRTELHRTAVDAGTIVQAAFEVLHGRAEQGGVSLVEEIAPDMPALDADQDRLEQAVLNLVDNAIKYTPPGGQVTVRTRPLALRDVPEVLRRDDRTSFCELVVADTGVGVPPEDLPRLTERFYRVDKARSRQLGGTGLGLAIVKHIIQAHGGTLQISSELHHGTTVRLVLPAHDAQRVELSERALRSA
ncbi:PAS domain-containing protein [bacterium]|nr:PAS domain-containing protein [bacterium]